MKKFIYTLVIAFVATVASSCTEEEISPNTGGTNTEDSGKW